MPGLLDLTGQKYGRLSVIRRNGHIGNHTAWECVCECGTIGTWKTNSLRMNATTSCGCYHREMASSANITHGMSKTPEYETWTKIMQRCYNPNVERYRNYGGRGVEVCERWIESFEAFYEDMGSRPGPEYSIERKEVNGDYSPNNCYWATEFEQSRNRTTNRVVLYQGKEMIAKDVAISAGVSYVQLRYHLDHGKTADQAVEYLLSK